uniref:Uncharacterized protein n=2 Tax=Pan TaxID=9596 RepID=A0A2I3TEB3_PANTR
MILYTIFLKAQEDFADYGDLWASLRIAFPLRFFLSVSHTFSPNFRHTLPAFPLLIHSSPSLNLIVYPVACCLTVPIFAQSLLFLLLCIHSFRRSVINFFLIPL